MKTLKKILNFIFIDGLSGMALGLFSTLIIGTILDQIASFLPGTPAAWLHAAAMVAKSLTGAGIGVGMAFKYKAAPLVGVSAAVAGMVGAFAAKLLSGAVIDGAALTYGGPGDPLGAFLAALCAVAIGKLISGKTKLDILLTPAVCVCIGSAVGLIAGPPASKFSAWMGEIIRWGTERQPILMGVIVAVVMGICLTLPISSAALGIILDLSGIAGGAAVIGCSAQMVGFAVASYRENRLGGLLAQGVGTSMLQMPNIVRRPQIWLPPILASAVLGPISTRVLGMTCYASGAGMGTSGLVGQFMTYASMTDAGADPKRVLLEILLMHVIAPAALTLLFSELMRKAGWIKAGDMKLGDLQ